MGVVLPDDPRVEHRDLGEGPWISAFVVSVETPVRSKSNFRRRQVRGQQWSQVKEFEDRLAATFGVAKPSTWPEDDPTSTVKQRHAVVGVCYARSVLDTSNLSKSIYDAAEGILYANDSQVRAETSMVERGVKNPFLVGAFAAIPGETDPLLLGEVTAQLWEAVREMTEARRGHLSSELEFSEEE